MNIRILLVQIQHIDVPIRHPGRVIISTLLPTVPRLWPAVTGLLSAVFRLCTTVGCMLYSAVHQV